MPFASCATSTENFLPGGEWGGGGKSNALETYQKLHAPASSSATATRATSYNQLRERTTRRFNPLLPDVHTQRGETVLAATLVWFQGKEGHPSFPPEAHAPNLGPWAHQQTFYGAAGARQHACPHLGREGGISINLVASLPVNG